MKQLLAVIVISILSNVIIGQDIITKQDGDEIKAKVTEIGINEIKYKNFDNLNGPVYILNKSDVFMIKYENGEKEIIKAESPNVVNPSNPAGSSSIRKTYSITASDVSATHTAGVIGYIMAIPITGLVTGTVLADDYLVGGILGGVATLSLGISAPMIAGKARKTRELTNVEGAYAARLVGWILYGITMADAITALTLNAFEFDVPDATTIALGVLGSLSSILLGLDAIKTAEQSKQYIASPRIVPTLNISRNYLGTHFTSLGIQLNF